MHKLRVIAVRIVVGKLCITFDFYAHNARFWVGNFLLWIKGCVYTQNKHNITSALISDFKVLFGSYTIYPPQLLKKLNI